MRRRLAGFAFLAAVASAAFACGGVHIGFGPAAQPSTFDVIVRNGTVYDGSGAAGQRADVGIRRDIIAAIGDLSNARGRTEVNALGLAVAPGFINMLSWSTESLLVDGRSLGEISQGVTTQIFGEGDSMGPLSLNEVIDRSRSIRGWTAPS